MVLFRFGFSATPANADNALCQKISSLELPDFRLGFWHSHRFRRIPLWRPLRNRRFQAQGGVTEQGDLCFLVPLLSSTLLCFRIKIV
jgi:hypothetical protein